MLDLTPDLSAAHSFLMGLTGETNHLFQVIPNSPGCEVKAAWKRGNVFTLNAWLTQNNLDGAGVYFTVNATDGKGRQAKNITAVRAAFVDLDGAPLEPILNCPAPPHYITESSPGRYQVFWKVSDLPIEKFRGIQVALADRFEGDLAVKDLPRVMRLPGFYHMKGEPFMCHVMKSHDEPAYTLHSLILRLQLTPKPEAAASFQPEQQLPIAKGVRNRTMVTIAARLRNAGLVGEHLFKALQVQNQERCKPPLTDVELAKIAKWALTKEVGIIRPARSMPESQSEYVPESKQDSPIMTWEALGQKHFDEPRWIIKDLLPEGLTILAGRPKVGKSWLVQHLALAVARGDHALDNFPCNRGGALCLAMEDTPRRFKYRMLMIADGSMIPDNAYFADSWPRLPKALVALDEWLQAATNPRMVIIDTLAKIRPKGRVSQDGVYDRDYSDIAEFQKLAGHHQVAIVMVHHLRKADVEDDFDSVSGSVGITGAADTVMILKRPDRQKMEGELVISGRDISDRAYALAWQEQKGLWCYMGTPEQAAESKGENRVLDVLQDSGYAMTVTEIAEECGKSRQYTQRVLDRLVDKEKIDKSVSGKRYSLMPITADQNPEF